VDASPGSVAAAAGTHAIVVIGRRRIRVIVIGRISRDRIVSKIFHGRISRNINVLCFETASWVSYWVTKSFIDAVAYISDAVEQPNGASDNPDSQAEAIAVALMLQPSSQAGVAK
jgi:hypothetical protein